MLAVFATPFIAGSQFLTMFDRVMGTHFFVPDQGGDVVMYQHIFWFYSHPAVYIMLLPGFGIISEVIATFARKPLFGYRAMAFSMVAIAVLGFGVWAHHMFVSGMAAWLRVPMMVTTIIIAVPTGVKMWSWLATLWRGKIHMKPPMLWALGFLFTFLIGGLSGVFNGIVPADIHVSDTYFVTAHLHYVLYGGTVYTVFAGIYYWFPKATGRMMNERLSQWHFWLTFVGTQITFMPMHWQGLQGMPRRVADYDPRFETVNAIETVGSYMLGIATIIFFYNVYWSLKHGDRASWNPWRGRTLEWMVSSTPPLFNFDVIPQVVGGPYQYGISDARHAVVFAPEEFGGELTEDTRVTLSDMDSSPTKAWLIAMRKDPRWSPYYDRVFALRPREELYDLKKDPHQVHNIAADPAYTATRAALEKRLMDELHRTGDPRVVEDGRFFETPPMAGPLATRPKSPSPEALRDDANGSPKKATPQP
jgi:cytochrome c oxidase subunit 1